MSSKKKDPPEPMEEKELPAEENEKEKEAEAPAAEASKEEPKVEKEPEKPAEPSADALLKAEKDRYLRLLAEYDNYRKRSSKERESIYQDVRADTVTKFLPVYDNLVRALDQATCDEAYRKGVEMIMTQLRDILSRMGVTEIESLGQKFDPALHNAVMHEEDETKGEGEIVQELQKGFKMGDKVIRFAMVKVAN
jgi:molecular chaperone GrpE